MTAATVIRYLLCIKYFIAPVLQYPLRQQEEDSKRLGPSASSFGLEGKGHFPICYRAGHHSVPLKGHTDTPPALWGRATAADGKTWEMLRGPARHLGLEPEVSSSILGEVRRGVWAVARRAAHFRAPSHTGLRVQPGITASFPPSFPGHCHR